MQFYFKEAHAIVRNLLLREVALVLCILKSFIIFFIAQKLKSWYLNEIKTTYPFIPLYTFYELQKLNLGGY